MKQYRKKRSSSSQRRPVRNPRGKPRRRAWRRNHLQRLRRYLLLAATALLLLSIAPVLVFRWLPPPTSAVMLARTLAEGQRQTWQWVDIDRISPNTALAVVAAEDQKFPDHFGFDLQAIQDAVSDNARGRRLRGASTLTQQVARNLFLWQGRSYLRKGLEAWMAVLLEVFWPKQRILEIYLNIAETGERMFGIEAAARRYFGQSAATLTPEQAALVAAVLPNPRRLHADRPSAYVLGRRDHILRQMDLLGGPGYLGEILPRPSGR
jgi:monofunctional biosynthetic peptidoglycan transglycosylase